MDGSSPAISTRSLTKQYGSTTAVDGLSFEVPSGVVYGFLGPNGAGKTTTMRMLTGLVEPTDGDGFVAGTHCSERRHLVDRIGLLPEKPPLYDELTGREQLQFAADLRDIPWERVSDRALGLADRLDLDDDLDRRIDGYSKGMRQKTAFVQAVQHDPAVVFLDEPTSGLDPRAARTLRELIVELADDGTTVFLSTHILPVVEEIADQVGVLYDGRLVSEGSPAELTDGVDDDGDADLEEAFLELTDDPATAW
ncbi:ABC-type multidrug transport system, ATPase component [Halapricum desulfuricans]|uniref:ABC-type multidrug transport system, ATPase component n=1 Tax=Halapricum desulfuricans TaxID=2841257 RepID=A0A897NLU5_9EURY|nr:ABC transporter ATP-binding protein [Halapricum desulfuricans]QSG11903.1 ABC-type multidrug transport system, ATPase component [Halapricum desulfuricans]